MPFEVKEADNGLKIVANIPIAAVGEEWMTMGGPRTVTEEDLRSAIDALNDPAIKTPRVKLGHLDPRFTPDQMSPDGDPFDGTPVLGRFENLQIGDKGMTLYADAVGVPEWFANIMPYAYPNRSIEGDWFVKTPTGQEHDFVITAVSLLGDEYPAIETLDDLQILFSKEGPDWVKEVEAEFKGVAAAKGIWDMPKPTRSIAASVSVEDIRRSFFEDFATVESGRWDWWTRSVYVDPNLVIATDFDDNLFACPYTLKDDGVEWGEPAEVFTQYVEVDGGKVLASKAMAEKPAVASFSKSGGSRPENKPKEDNVARIQASIDVGNLRTRLGLTEEQLPDDATEEQINEALAGPAPGSSPDPATTENPNQPPSGTPAAGTPQPGQPTEGGAVGPDGTPVGTTGATDVPGGQADFARVEREAYERLQQDAAAGRAAREEQLRARREARVDAAIRAGKITPARRAHFSGLMERDEEGTTEFLNGLEAGVVPVGEETGNGNSPEAEALSGSEYPSEWLTDAERTRVAAAREGKARSTRVVAEAQ